MSGRLTEFVASTDSATLSVLVNYLAERSDEYVKRGLDIAREGGPKWSQRAEHHRSMAQALYSLAETINKEKEQQHGHQ